MKIISESSAVSVGLVALLVTGMFWLGSLAAQGHSNARTLEKHEVKLEAIQSINVRLAKIEVLLEAALKKE